MLGAKMTANYLNTFFKQLHHGAFIKLKGFDFIAGFNSGADLAMALDFQRFMASLFKKGLIKTLNKKQKKHYKSPIKTTNTKNPLIKNNNKNRFELRISKKHPNKK